jgi:hypothetical protein
MVDEYREVRRELPLVPLAHTRARARTHTHTHTHNMLCELACGESVVTRVWAVRLREEITTRTD